jgi:phosphatidate cytidylyltransferase
VLTRVVTGTLAAAIVLAAILWREPWGVILLAVAVLALGGIELARIVGWPDASALCLLALPAVLLSWPPEDMPITTLVVPTALPWFLGALALFLWKPNRPLQVCGLWLWLVVGALCLVLLQLQTLSGDGSIAPNLLLLALLPLWVGDSLAYFAGRSIGKHKLAPSISPNKTWEGAVANLVGCLATAYAIGLWLEIPFPASIAVGLSTGILGQVGDLLQSRLKRLAEVKDSGSILPGHGGVLDRLDSFLFSSYPSLLALHLLAPGLFHVKQWPW